MIKGVVLSARIELATSSLPRTRSTTELRQQSILPRHISLTKGGCATTQTPSLKKIHPKRSLSDYFLIGWTPKGCRTPRFWHIDLANLANLIQAERIAMLFRCVRGKETQ